MEKLEFKGTKLPWILRNEHGLIFVESSKENLGSPYGQEILGSDYFNEECRLEDAKLISAAPDLLEALQNAIERMERAKGILKRNSDGNCGMLDTSDLQKAIEKALK